MKRVHFKLLESHRQPTLRLFRRLIKYSYHVPISPSYQSYLRCEISKRFHDGKKVMGPTKTGELLTQASQYEARLRQAIVHQVEHGETKENSEAKWVEDQIHDLMKSQQQDYESKEIAKLEWNPAPKGRELENLRQVSRVQNQRGRMIKAYQASGRLPQSIGDIDPDYIDYVLLPEWMGLREREREAKKRQIQTEKPRTAHIANASSPLGRIWFLRPFGTQSPSVTSIIRQKSQNNTLDQIKAYTDMETLAAQEAEWEMELERHCNPSAQDLSAEYKQKTVEQWTSAYRESIMSANMKKRAFQRKAENYASIIVSRKRLKDIELVGKFQRDIAKWKAIDKKREEEPYLWCIHSDVRKLS